MSLSKYKCIKPTKYLISADGYPCVQFLDVTVSNQEKFKTEFGGDLKATLTEAGCCPEVVCTADVSTLRGEKRPNYIVIHAWKDEAGFRSFYDGGNYSRISLKTPAKYSCNLSIENWLCSKKHLRLSFLNI